MQLNEICKVCGLTKKAVNYYVDQQLVQPQILGNGYRDFSQQDAEILKKVAVLRRLGLSIQTIRTVFTQGAQTPLRLAVQQKAALLDVAQEQLSLLRCLADTQDWDAIRQQLDIVETKQPILLRLTNAFPGHYGNYLRLHFARFLDQPIESTEQQEAFQTVVHYLDNVDFTLSPDLMDYLEQAARALDQQAEAKIAANMERVINDPEAYFTEHKDELEAYLVYKASAAYKKSPASRLQEQLYQLHQQTGYYDVFLPAMKRLSPSYSAYCKGLEAANQVFLQHYPDASF